LDWWCERVFSTGFRVQMVWSLDALAAIRKRRGLLAFLCVRLWAPGEPLRILTSYRATVLNGVTVHMCHWLYSF
jgi:hypothetical protein